MERYEDLMTYSRNWLLVVSGTFLLCLAILNVVQRQPRNRFAWSYSLNRAITGVILIVVGAFVKSWGWDRAIYWM